MRTQTIRVGLLEGKQQDPATRILQAAKEVFLREGAAKFSSRAVAKEINIRLSSVQHFFPTTNDLLLAMIRFVDGLHTEIYQNMEAKLPLNAVDRLRAVIAYLLEDLFKADTMRFYYGVWALSLQHKEVALFLEQAYAQHRNTLAVLIGAARPSLSESRCRDLALHVAATIEGLMIFIPPAGMRPNKRDEFVRSAKATIWTLLTVDSAPATDEQRDAHRGP